MLLQRGHGGNQGTHASGNAHRCCQDVIHHQRGCGQQSGPHAKVFTGDRVRSATLRIRHDGLAVGEVYDGEEDDDTDTDGDYVSHPGHSQRNQERQCSFRPIGCGAERIQAENGNPFGGSYSFSFLFLGRKRSAQQQFDKIHGSILPQACVQRWRQTGTQSELIGWEHATAMVRDNRASVRTELALRTTMASNWYPIGVDWLGTRNGDGLVASLIYGLRGTGRRALDRHSIRPRRRHVGLWRAAAPNRYASDRNSLVAKGWSIAPALTDHLASSGSMPIRWLTAQRSFCLHPR